MKWFKFTLPPAQSAGSQLRTLQDLFIELFTAAPEPESMALFSTGSSPNTFYICASKHSFPQVNTLLDSYNASPCHKPKDEKLNLLAGNAPGIDKLLQNSDT